VKQLLLIPGVLITIYLLLSILALNHSLNHSLTFGDKIFDIFGIVVSAMLLGFLFGVLILKPKE